MRANNFKDITGQRFGRLTVVSLSHIDKENRAVWKCKCDCGKETTVSGKSLRSGNTSSCGCLSIDVSTEKIVRINTKHGKSHTRLFRVWSNMKNRCHNQNATNYKDYGERGIDICPEWENNFESFYSWAMDNGYDPTAKRGICTIDRIDNNRGYSPENCRIANSAEQANNRRSTVLIAYNGESKSAAEWAKHFGKSPSRIERMGDEERIATFDAYEQYKKDHGKYPRKLSNGYARRKL